MNINILERDASYTHPKGYSRSVLVTNGVVIRVIRDIRRLFIRLSEPCSDIRPNSHDNPGITIEQPIALIALNNP